MADNGGFFARLGQLWSGFWSLWVGGRERSNPELVYEAAINDRVRQYSDLKKAVSNIIYLRNQQTKDLEDSMRDLKDTTAQLGAAVDADDDEVAMLLIQKKDQLTSRIEQLKVDLEKTAAQAEESKTALIAFQADIEKLKREKDELAARKQTAEARIKIQETLSGMSTEADVKALDNVREHVHKLEAEADINKELGASTLDARLAKIKAKAATSTARAQLDALKAARAAEHEVNPAAVAAQAAVKKTI